ncbi:MAG: fasciclin domain-containing protein [Phycisphaeraceae bacterium]|nr:fasciclin domain-containing protein [Phycisphaeraceae bacterium]
MSITRLGVIGVALASPIAITCMPATVSAGSPAVGQSTASTGAGSIVDVATGAGKFRTLLAAARAADLVPALSGDGPFTLFAPTDEAFALLPAGTVENLLKPENRATLTAILTFHVVPAKLSAEAVSGRAYLPSLQGQRLEVESTGRRTVVAGATVTQADVPARNGVIHVIDRVMLPASDSIVDIASKAGTFNTLLTAATAAGLAEALTGPGPLTVLAPSDDAFAKLPAGTVESLLKPENREKLAGILRMHVMPGRVYCDEAVSAGRATTLLGGNPLRVSVRDGRVVVNGANIVRSDIDARNGVVHVIDRVLLPG